MYILFAGEQSIVLGHGKKNRAKIVLDTHDRITSSHLKALFVRLHLLYGGKKLTPYLISCRDKDEAKLIENQLHKTIGGNHRIIPEHIIESLFYGIDTESKYPSEQLRHKILG